MPYTLELVTPPTAEPIDLDHITSHLRIDDVAAESALLYGLMPSARQYLETVLHTQLMPATYKLYLDDWADWVSLPMPPTTAVTLVEYLDTDGDLQTLASTVYQTDLISTPARFGLAEDQSWPSLQGGTVNTVRITFTAGYASAAAVPDPIKLAIAMLVGDMYEHREARLDINGGLRSIEDNPTVQRLVWAYRNMRLA